ncbi:MAG: hypothetical protein AAFX46_17725 [Cyanobacteria bacterium J06636_27]
MGKGQSYEEIASELGTSADACLKRMGQVYKKFNVSVSSRGKENRLRIFLSIEDKEDVLSFLYDLPPTVKVIITTREQTLFVPIRLNYLPKENS